jgi:hypothetical protein
VSIHPIEAVWLGTTLLGLLFAILGLGDAIADRSAIRKANGRAREIVGDGNVKREVLLLLVQVALLVVVVPGLFVNRDIPLSPPIVALTLVPVLLAGRGALDARERRRLADILESDIAHERRQALRDAR